MTEFTLQTRAGGAIGSLDLGRPEAGNRLTRADMRSLTAALDAAAGQPELRVLELRARGEMFCAGRDPGGESYAGRSAFEIREQSMSAVLGVYAALRAVPVPVVARVQGDAVGFGAALAAACDITLAADAARFSFPEIDKDIAPTMAMTAVRDLVPAKTLAWLIYSAERLTADEARAAGLVSTVLPAAGFEAAADAAVERLAARPRPVLVTIKTYQRNATGMSAAAASDYAGALLALVRSA